MPSENRYVSPLDVLGALSVEINSEEPLTGFANYLRLRAHNTHQVLPYAVSGSLFNSYSIERMSAGSVTFSGLLVSTVGVLQNLLAGFGSMARGTPTRFRLLVPGNPATVLVDWDLWDYRLNGSDLSMIIRGRSAMVMGQFSATFRKLVPHVDPDPPPPLE